HPTFRMWCWESGLLGGLGDRLSLISTIILRGLDRPEFRALCVLYVVPCAVLIWCLQPVSPCKIWWKNGIAQLAGLLRCLVLWIPRFSSLGAKDWLVRRWVCLQKRC